MSGSGDEFGEDTAKLENVRPLTATDYLSEYTGILAETDERVRIVTLAAELADTDAAVDAFAQVSDTWYNASANANILAIRDRGSEPRPWVAVADHGGDTFATVQPDLSPAAIETVISETADALRTLGLYNTVHGHLSPEDIYLPSTADGAVPQSVLVGGFGLEAAVQAGVGEFSPAAYTAPERLDNPDQPTERTDVYGLAAVTYFALTGHPPIAAPDLNQAIRDGPSTPPSAYDDMVPADLDDVVLQGLATHPEDRYDSPYAFGRAFVSAFAPDALGDDDTSDESGGATETADGAAESTESAGAVPDEDDDSSSKATDESTDSEDTNGASMTRRAAVGLLGVGALGGAGWYLSRGQLTAPGPADETGGLEPPAEPSASISVTPADPAIGEEVTFSAAGSSTGEGVSLETYEWAVGADAEFSVEEETLTRPFSESGEHMIRLRITDSRNRTATATTTVTVTAESAGNGAPMFQYNAANTGTTSSETGPQTSISERWSYQTDDGVYSSPAVVGGTVYVGGWDSYVYALSADDGTERWSFQTEDSVTSSPAVVDGTVYVGSRDSNVYALSADDGTEQWSFQTEDLVYSSPTVVDNTVYVGSWDGNVYALSADGGTARWSFQTGGDVDSSPAVVNGTVYVGSRDNIVYALSADDGTEGWSYQTGDEVTSSPAVADGTVYVGSGDDNVYALSADDGSEQWSYQAGDAVESSPAVVDGTVYVGGSFDNTVYALSAADGTEQWSFQTGDWIRSSPAVVDRTVYVGSWDNSVYALSADDGTEQWSFQSGDDVRSGPAVADGTVYVGSADNNVYALSE